MSGDDGPEELRYIIAVNEALRWALKQYPEALLFGEDVALPEGPFGATRGLRREFGDRVFDTPISETAFVGAAIGAAMRGRRPIIEIMFIDFTQVAMDQLVNQLPNVHYVSRGAFRVPVTIRTQQGFTSGSCASIRRAWRHSLRTCRDCVWGRRLPPRCLRDAASGHRLRRPRADHRESRPLSRAGPVVLDGPVRPSAAPVWSEPATTSAS